MPAVGAEPRQAAWQILRAVDNGTLFDAARDRALGGLPDRDRRLAQEIAAGVLRHRRVLDGRLRRALGPRWRTTTADLRDLLRIGAYQLQHLTRVPAYAAIQSTVEAAKPLGRRRAAFINAGLRELLRNQGAAGSDGLASAGPREGADDPAARMARDLSHPAWLVQRWLRHYGLAATEALLRHNNAPPALVIQAARWDRERLAEAIRRDGHRCTPVPGGYGLVVGGAPATRLPGFAEGGFIVQGPAQAQLVSFAAVPTGARVWDCCAAPGGKAVVLALRGPVMASDRDRKRLERLTATVRRAGRGIAIFAGDARQPPLRNGSMDVVWVDAPCTATGNMARHPDARWRLSPRHLAALCRLQTSLLDRVSEIVADGGLLVYTTCSLEPEENVQQVDAFLTRRDDFVRDRSDREIFPTQTGSDGGFAAVLRKR